MEIKTANSLKIMGCPHCGREITKADVDEATLYEDFLEKEKEAVRRLGLSYFIGTVIFVIVVGALMVTNADKLANMLGNLFELGVVFFLATPILIITLSYLEAREKLFNGFKISHNVS